MAPVVPLEPWPPKSLSTVLVSASETICPSYASTKISAPASLVFSTLLDTSTYPEWNTWCPKVTIRSQPDANSDNGSPTSASSPGPQPSPVLQKDTHFTLRVVMDASKPSKTTDTLLRVTDISIPTKQSDYVPVSLLQSPSFTQNLAQVYRVAWTVEGGFVARGLRSERFQEVIVLGQEECEVRTWECLGGILARTVKWSYGGTLMEKFGLWVKDLKDFCERRYEGGRGHRGEYGEGDGGREEVKLP